MHLQDSHSVEHEAQSPVPTASTDGGGRDPTWSQRRYEKLPRPRTPSPPSRSLSTSTQSSARTMRARHSLHIQSPPPYSILIENDESWGPNLSADHSIRAGESSRIVKAPERQEYSGQKGQRRKDEEEEVEDRAELARMIGA